jgi:hypothetical protein
MVALRAVASRASHETRTARPWSCRSFFVLSGLRRFDGPVPACANETGEQLTQSNGARRGRRGAAREPQVSCC